MLSTISRSSGTSTPTTSTTTTSRPFASLSFFTIYNRELAQQEKEYYKAGRKEAVDKHLEETGPSSVAQRLEESRTSAETANDGEGKVVDGGWEFQAKEEKTKDSDGLDLLLFVSRDTSLKGEKRHRAIGLAQGLADFARMMSGPSAQVNSVHAEKQRMVFIEPEPGYILHAVIDLPRLIQTPSTSSSNKTPLERYINEGIEDEALLMGLYHGYHEFRLLNGTFESILCDEGRARLEAVLNKFYSVWVWRWNVDRAPCSFPDAVGAIPLSPLSNAKTLKPLISAFEASHPNTLPVLLCDGEIVYSPKVSIPDPSAPGSPIVSPPSSPSLKDGSAPKNSAEADIANTKPATLTSSPTAACLVTPTDLAALMRYLVSLLQGSERSRIVMGAGNHLNQPQSHNHHHHHKTMPAAFGGSRSPHRSSKPAGLPNATTPSLGATRIAAGMASKLRDGGNSLKDSSLRRTPSLKGGNDKGISTTSTTNVTAGSADSPSGLRTVTSTSEAGSGVGHGRRGSGKWSSLGLSSLGGLLNLPGTGPSFSSHPSSSAPSPHADSSSDSETPTVAAKDFANLDSIKTGRSNGEKKLKEQETNAGESKHKAVSSLKKEESVENGKGVDTISSKESKESSTWGIKNMQWMWPPGMKLGGLSTIPSSESPGPNPLPTPALVTTPAPEPIPSQDHGILTELHIGNKSKPASPAISPSLSLASPSGDDHDFHTLGMALADAMGGEVPSSASSPSLSTPSSPPMSQALSSVGDPIPPIVAHPEPSGPSTPPITTEGGETVSSKDQDDQVATFKSQSVQAGVDFKRDFALAKTTNTGPSSPHKESENLPSSSLQDGSADTSGPPSSSTSRTNVPQPWTEALLLSKGEPDFKTLEIHLGAPSPPPLGKSKGKGKGRGVTEPPESGSKSRGKEKGKASVLWFQRGPLTLSLITPHLCDQTRQDNSDSSRKYMLRKASRLLEGLELSLDHEEPVSEPPSHRFLMVDQSTSLSTLRPSTLNTGSEASWPGKDDQWSGKTNKKEFDISGGLLETWRGMENSILETTLRTGTSTWVIGKRRGEEEKVDSFLVLPKNIGREGSLVDSDHELRKFLNQYSDFGR